MDNNGYSYRFFINSFDRRYLTNYTILFFFNSLCRFQIYHWYMVQKALHGALNGLYLMVRCAKFKLSSHISTFYRFLLFTIMICMYILYTGTLVEWCFNFMRAYRVNILFQFVLCLFGCTSSSNLLYTVGLLFKHMRYLLGLFKFTRYTRFPAKSSMITLLKSPHVDKKARDQYALIQFRYGVRLFKLPLQLYTFFINSNISGIGIRVCCINHSSW